MDITEARLLDLLVLLRKLMKKMSGLTVMVSIFGRMTPVELGFNQINNDVKVGFYNGKSGKSEN